MSRFLLFPPFVLWMTWVSEPVHAPMFRVWYFLLGYLALVAGLGFGCRIVAEHVHARNLERSFDRVRRVIFLARWVVPIWFGAGLYYLGWGDLVNWVLHHALQNSVTKVTLPLETPGVVIATLPAFLAWVGLYWAQYPADRALREQSMLVQLDSGLPVRAPQALRQYMMSNLRMQVLFTVLPIFCIVVVRDALFMGLMAMGVHRHDSPAIDIALSLGAVAVVFPLAPEILRRTLETRALPESDLRDRLESLFARTKLKCRQILLWQTDSTVGNAAVMGLLPRFRYILLSDLLLETMDDEQIEAVFAHEVGHIKHRHVLWNIAVMLLAGAAGGVAGDALQATHLPWWATSDVVASVLSFATFVTIFGWISRRFERQADVYAARMIEFDAGLAPVTWAERKMERESNVGVAELAVAGTQVRTFVGEYGSRVFASALYRVATINNIRTTHKKWRGGTVRQYLAYLVDRVKHAGDNFLHGSIESRRIYLQRISSDPRATWRFDRFMVGLYGAIILGLLVIGAIVAMPMMKN